MNATSSQDPYIAYTHRFFAKWLGVYDLFALSIAPAYNMAVRAVAPRPGLEVLDVCTGTGEVARRLVAKGAEVTGIDITPGMLDKARAKVGDRARFLLMDARRLDFLPGSFDVATISFGLHDMPRGVRLQVLAEAARVARRLVVLDYDLPSQSFLRKLLTAGIALFESAYFKPFAAEGVPGLLAEMGLEASSRRRLWPSFSAWTVDLGNESSGGA